jgi:hypothetical protein
MAAVIAASIPDSDQAYVQAQQQQYQYQPMRGRRKIDCKPELVIASLQKFYATRDDLSDILPYLRGEGDLSLRLIDWFVTNYCRKHFVGYLLNGQEFLVYVSYKSQLKAYSKQYFDPNCRRERIQFQLPGYEPFLTTVGKLNFFRWAIETDILNYIRKNYDIIQKERIESVHAGLDGSVSTDSGDSNGRGFRTKRSSTESSFASTASAASTVTVMSSISAMSATTSQTRSTTRRRRTKQIPAASAQLQRHDMEIRVSFD